MKSYDETVADMLCFLKSKDVCLSSISSHRDCYQQFSLFMQEHEKMWEPAVVPEWIAQLRQIETSSLYCIWDLYMKQLEELSSTGTVPDRHLYLNRSTYDRLCKTMRSSLDDYLLEHLRVYLKIYHSDKAEDMPLFYTVIKGRTDRMSPGNVGRIINKYASAIREEHPDLPEKVYPHMFRRTRACNLYQDGVELELVSRILGHSSTQTTRIYATPSVEMMRRAMEHNDLSLPNEAPLWPDDEAEIAKLCRIR